MDVERLSTVKVVIIGAGMAGLSAARGLIQGGIKDVLILEAQGRVGGRVHTEVLGQNVIDYGAGFVINVDENPIWKLAVENDLGAEESSSSDHTSSVYYTSHGQPIQPNIVHDVIEKLDCLSSEADEFVCHNTGELRNFGAFVHRGFYKYLGSQDGSDEMLPLKEGIFHNYSLFECCMTGGSSIYEIGERGWTKNRNRSLLLLKQGFHSVIDVLLEDIPKHCIRLNCRARTVHWQPEASSPVEANSGDVGLDTSIAEVQSPITSNKMIDVYTDDGSTIKCNYVIVTSSLGCLKQRAHTMFKPLLPIQKMSAIQRLGFQTTDRIILEFEAPFWEEDPFVIGFTWLPHEPFKIQCVEKKNQEEYLRREWYRAIAGFATMSGAKKLLCGYICGIEADVMETLPDTVVLDVCHELLQRFTNRPNLTKPSRLYRSKWYLSDYITGSTSFVKSGNTSADFDILAAPLFHQQEPRVMFAGEATHRQFNSTTHGAFLSGEREARRILEWQTKDRERMAQH